MDNVNILHLGVGVCGDIKDCVRLTQENKAAFRPQDSHQHSPGEIELQHNHLQMSFTSLFIHVCVYVHLFVLYDCKIVLVL
ncbi:hypothetical protein EXN66_Car007932 [Channa argus]|uniref:Uncharacterized protein n=1 Tax=Channa argus TaxID=215402 RepID=A0A6G1PQI7_CHAAH|nr:hypothetical protein EXN66_Car007932 [Channa argus]